MMSEKKVVITESEESVKNLKFDNLETHVDVIEVSTKDNGEIQENFYGEDESVAVEDLPDEEEIWPGGPTAGMIKEWKQEYGDIYVTSISFDKHIVWRVLNRAEYKAVVRQMENLLETGQLSSAEANMWNEEAIAEMCTLYPEYNDNMYTGRMAGTPSLIAQEVLEASGFVALEVRQL